MEGFRAPESDAPAPAPAVTENTAAAAAPQVDAFSVESDGVAWRQFAAREEDAIKRVLLLLQLEQQQRRRAAAAPGGAVAGLSWKALDSLLKARAAAARRRADSREFSEERRQRISTVSAEFSSEDAEAASSGRELREVLLEEGWSVVENVKQQTIRLPRALRSLLLQQGGFGLKELLQSAIEKSGNSPFFPALSPVFSSLAEEARAGVTPRHLSMSEAYSRAYKQLADAVHPHKLTRAVKVDGHYLYPWSVFTKQEREQLWLMADQLKWLPKWIKHHRVARKPPPRVLKTHLPVLKPKFTDIYGGPGAPSLGAEPGVRYTWLGHASGLVTIDGLNVLIDPVLGEDIVGAMSDLAKRFLNFVNSKLCGSLGERLRPAPARISELPSDLHLVILSHNHQDHIMERDIKHLCRTHKERFKHLMWYVPEGVAWFLVKHGCSPQRVCEFTWGESRTLSCMPRNGQYACSDGVWVRPAAAGDALSQAHSPNGGGAPSSDESGWQGPSSGALHASEGSGSGRFSGHDRGGDKGMPSTPSKKKMPPMHRSVRGAAPANGGAGGGAPPLGSGVDARSAAQDRSLGGGRLPMNAGAGGAGGGMQQFRASRLAGAPPAGAEGSLGEARASEAAVDRFTITYVGNVHWSGRSPAKADHNTSLWGGFAIKGPRHNFFYGGDTSYFRKDFDEFRKVGRLLGPFHLAALAIGAYEPNEDLRYQHVNPQEALMLFKDIRAEVGVGVHWGTMRLSAENFFDPMLELECALLGVSVGVCRGETVPGGGFVAGAEGGGASGGGVSADIPPNAPKPLATKEAAVPDGKRGKKAATQEAAAGSGERAGSGADAGAKKNSSSADASAEGASTAREEETDTLVAGSTLTASVLFEPEPELEAAPTVAAATAAGAAAAADDAPSSSRGTTREADGEAAKGTGLKAADTPAQTPSLQRRQPHSKLRDAIDHLLENPLSVLRRGRRPTNMREAIFPGHFYRSTLQPVALWSDPLLHPSNARRLRRAEKLEALGLLHHDPHWREKLLVEGARFQTLHIGHSIQVEQGDDGTHILMSRSSARDHIDPQATAEQYAFLPLYLKPASAGVSNGRNSGVRNGAKGTHARGGGVSASPMEAARGQQSDEVGSMEVAFSRVAVGVGVPNLRRQQRAAPAGSAIRPSSKADSPVAAGVEEEDEETEVFDIMD
ncbi:uncharacterized protein LOC34623024 [Cyclospora cayetanensis]|uniref:Uncharacterized protein LOC34623024 n=1 Tax=Cyclospora cayetanensis TaxID=88456 RepID=A0A6P6RSQ0_9EIME|nr:uncharacterized protein LOC34623024 [Cyclospora cayetanensis]